MNVNRNLIFEFDDVANDNNLNKSTNNEEDNKINSTKTLPIKKKKRKSKSVNIVNQRNVLLTKLVNIVLKFTVLCVVDQLHIIVKI